MSSGFDNIGKIMKPVRYMRPVIYKIQLSEGLVSISIDKTLSDLLALKLGFKPDSPEAKKAVCAELNNYIANDRGRGKQLLRNFLQQEAILRLIPKELEEEWRNFTYGAL